MGVYVKGMKMPKNCNECEFHSVDDVSFELIHQCLIKGAYIDYADLYSFPYDCPLVEVSTPHGRLIDGDVLLRDIVGITDGWMKPPRHWRGHEDSVKHAETVIEAEDE